MIAKNGDVGSVELVAAAGLNLVQYSRDLVRIKRKRQKEGMRLI